MESRGTKGGHVALVGAGPGDVGLLTLRAADCLAKADVVLFDALVSKEIIALAKDADCYDVGKRAGRHSVAQSETISLLIQHAQDGKYVVRLKGGDPLMLGRGGEEALALAREHISFEIVPGVSSALAAPALAGIPVTHRGVSSSVTVVSGHSPQSYAPVLSGLAPHCTSIVVLMGLGHRREIAQLLVAQGWREDTPVARVYAASTPNESIVHTTLEAMAAEEATISAYPGVLVIGDVVDIGQALQQAGHGPRVMDTTFERGVPAMLVH